MSYQQCEAREYGDCYRHNKIVDVTFMYRDFKGRRQPDEVVKVCMCKGHHDWLSKIHQGKPLEMRGEAAEYALHDDLFIPFTKKERMYTLLRVEEVGSYNENEHLYYLFNCRDVKAIREKIQCKNEKFLGMYEVGFFQTTVHLNTESNAFEELIIEVKPIKGEMALDALVNRIKHVNMMTPGGTSVAISDWAYMYIPRDESENKYTIESDLSCSVLNLMKPFFKKKQRAEQYTDFTECCAFIEGNIDKNIVNWNKLRENSPHTEEGLFQSFQQLTEALINKNDPIKTVSEMKDGGDVTADVLWLTYVSANHRLFASDSRQNDLTKNKELIDLFICHGLEKDLLALAISGERERYLSIRQRDHYDILYENEFVVEYLVPQYIATTDVIYKYEHTDAETPLEYWQSYDNTTLYIGGGFSSGRDTTETFEKNEKIRLHLEQYVTVVEE